MKQLVSEFQGELESELALDEGYRAMPYKDTAGHTTIGIGHNLDASPLLPGLAAPLSYADAIDQLRYDLTVAEHGLSHQLDWYAPMPEDARKGVLIDLGFNLGVPKLIEFSTFLSLMRDGNWQGASFDLLNTAYAKQLPIRCSRLAKQILTNIWAVPMEVE